MNGKFPFSTLKTLSTLGKFVLAFCSLCRSRDRSCSTKGLRQFLFHATAASSMVYSATVFASDSLRVEDVILDVLKHNNGITAAQYMEQAAREKVFAAGKWDDPMLMVGVVSLPTNLDFKMDPMTMQMIGLSQNIPLAGSNHLERKVAIAEANVAFQDRRTMQADMIMVARYAFADLFYLDKTKRDVGALRDLLKEVHATVQAKLSSNQASREEVLSSETELWRIESQLIEIERQCIEARYRLNVVRGAELDVLVVPIASTEPIGLPTSPEEWLDSAKLHYPPFQKLLDKSKSFGYSRDLEKSMKWPMLGLTASYGIRLDSEEEERDNMLGFQANFSLPIFSRSGKTRMAAAMEAMRLSTDLEAVQLWKETEGKLRSLYQTAIQLSRSIELYSQRIIPTSKGAFQSALSGYSAGRVSYSQLLLLAAGIYRDLVSLNQLENQLAYALAESDNYITDPDSYSRQQVTNSK